MVIANESFQNVVGSVRALNLQEVVENPLGVVRNYFVLRAHLFADQVEVVVIQSVTCSSVATFLQRGDLRVESFLCQVRN